MNTHQTPTPTSPSYPAATDYLTPLKYLCLFCSLLFWGWSSPAAGTTNLFWDASGSGAASDGSGNWFTNSSLTANMVWWNGTADQNWSGSSNAIIGASVPGNYFITNNIAGGAQLTASAIIFTNVGTYSIVMDGNSADQGQLVLNGSGGGLSAFAPAIYVGTNLNAVIAVPWALKSDEIYLATNASLTVSMNTCASFGAGLVLKGFDPRYSTFWCTNGMLGCNFASPSSPTSYNQLRGTSTTGGLTWNITGAAVVNMTDRFDISRNGLTGAGANASTIINVGGVGPWVGATGVQAQLNGDTQNAPGSGAASSSDGSQNIQISRGGSPAVLNLLPGGLISTFTCQISPNIGVNGKLKLAPDGNGPAAFSMSGGILTLGSGPTTVPGYNNSYLTPITFFDGTTPGATASAIFNMSGGVAGVKGLEVGSGSAFAATTTNQINITGGMLYLDAENIHLNSSSLGNNFGINLSGGTIGATANWSPALSAALNLTNINGNITFQAADAGGTPWNMSISSTMSGTGGLNKTGGGALTLTGANTYTGSTVVSNGTLVISTISQPTNGPVVLEGASLATGLPVASVMVAGIGQHWSIGNLTYDSGTPTADFNFGTLMPSSTSAPILANGNVAFNVTPQISVEASNLVSGSYPLIKYTGTLSGTPPTSLISLPPGVTSAAIVNDTANHSVDLQIISTNVVPITWLVGNGNWNFSTANWKQGANTVDYLDGDQVIFDDTASGASPIAVTLNTTVNPASIGTLNSTKSYIIAGSGTIAGPTAVNVSGAAGLTLAGTNTYSGGTVVTAPGLLAINYGGDGVANSAIGTGPLTLNLNSKLDNTSGHAVTLNTVIPETWGDDFTFIGTTNFDTGLGQITLGNSTTVTVNSNTFEVDGPITDNGSGYGLLKVGNGTLTLTNGTGGSYSYSGGMQLSAGTLDINSDGVVGSGAFIIGGGTIDNTSGNPLSLTTYGLMKWNASFTFSGSASLDFAAISTIDLTAMTLTVNSNTLTTEGYISGGNNVMTKAGAGAWTIGGPNTIAANGAFGINITGGTVNLNSPLPYTALSSATVTVNSNTLLQILNPTGFEIAAAVPVTLSGGTFELNGDGSANQPEKCGTLTFNSGVLRNSAPGITAMLYPQGGLSLIGTNCDFNVTDSTAGLTIVSIVTNSGWLVKTGPGTLTLATNNVYIGDTIVNAGTLSLSGIGSISNTAVIDVFSNATLDVSGRSDDTLTLNSGQTLTGGGAINGNLVTAPGSELAPGNGIGTLTVNNNVTLGGSALFELNRNNPVQTNDELVSVSGGITGGGTLTVTNLGSHLVVGDTFQLFSSAVSGFSNVQLPVSDASGYTYTWNNYITANGSITVASAVAPSTINMNAGPVQVSVSGNNLNLGWPTNLGWHLQTQTNSLASGLGTNWVDLPATATMTNMVIPLSATNGTVFFRLHLPQP